MQSVQSSNMTTFFCIKISPTHQQLINKNLTHGRSDVNYIRHFLNSNSKFTERNCKRFTYLLFVVELIRIELKLSVSVESSQNVWKIFTNRVSVCALPANETGYSSSDLTRVFSTLRDVTFTLCIYFGQMKPSKICI